MLHFLFLGLTMATLRTHSMSSVKMLVEALSAIIRVLASVKRRSSCVDGEHGERRRCYEGVRWVYKRPYSTHGS